MAFDQDGLRITLLCDLTVTRGSLINKLDYKDFLLVVIGDHQPEALLDSGFGSMKQVIEEVLQAEERVGTLLKGAREQADQIRRSTEQEVSTLLSDARAQAQASTQAFLDEVKKEAEQIKEDRLKQADQAKDTLLNDNADKVDDLVKNVCHLIMDTTSD